MIRDFGLLLAVGIAAICLGSIILPLAILGIREYKSPTKGRDFREGPLGRLVVWLGSIPARAAVAARGREPRRSSPAASWSRTSSCCRPTRSSGSTRQSQVIKDLHVVEQRDRRRRASSASSCTTRRRLHRQVRRRSSTTSPASSSRKYPEHAAHRLEHRDRGQRHHRRRARRDATSRRRRRTCKAAYDVAPPDIKASTVDRRRPGVQHHLPHRPRLARGARAGRARDPRQRRTRPRASAPRRRASRSSASACSTTSRRTASMLTYLAILFVFLFLAVRLRSDHPVAAVARAGADRGRASRRSSRTRSASS